MPIAVQRHLSIKKDKNSVEWAAAPQDIFALSCPGLWQQRNSIFKAAGYCFHTPRASSAFGNAGCAYCNEYDVPPSERDRQVINTIKQIERMKGCPR